MNLLHLFVEEVLLVDFLACCYQSRHQKVMLESLAPYLLIPHHQILQEKGSPCPVFLGFLAYQVLLAYLVPLACLVLRAYLALLAYQVLRAGLILRAGLVLRVWDPRVLDPRALDPRVLDLLAWDLLVLDLLA